MYPQLNGCTQFYPKFGKEGKFIRRKVLNSLVRICWLVFEGFSSCSNGSRSGECSGRVVSIEFCYFVLFKVLKLTLDSSCEVM